MEQLIDRDNGNRGNGTAEPGVPRIIVGIVANLYINAFFAEHYQSALIGHGELFYADQIWQIGGITDDGRNTIVKKAIELDYDYVFFMDSDMLFPKGSLARLLRTQLDISINYPDCVDMPTVIGGIYNTRGDHRINVYDWIEGENCFKVKDIKLNNGIRKCDFVATGCQLIDLNVFKILEFPWFEYWYKSWNPKKEIGRWSEDAVFAKKCYDANIPHFVDTSLVCAHLHEVQIVQADSDNYEVRKLSGELY